MTGTNSDLQNVMEHLEACCNVYGFKTDLKKTKSMVITELNIVNIDPVTESVVIEKAYNYKY